MCSYSNILLVEIEDPRKISEMKEGLLKEYPQIDILKYHAGPVIVVNCNGTSKEDLMESIKSKDGIRDGIREVILYEPIEKSLT